MGGLAASSAVRAQEPVLLHAAGSLRAALTEVTQAFTAQSGLAVKPAFGASGLLRERIAKGEAAEVFASADLGNPRALAKEGRSGPVVLFARNELCAFLRPGVTATPETLLERMLDTGLKLGTSTPRADPSGDYAFQVFARAEAVKPGARAALEAKALQLTGGPGSAPAPDGLNVYGHNLASGAGRPVPRLLHQRGADREGAAGDPPRQAAAGAGGGCRIRVDRDERGLVKCGAPRHVHPRAGGPGDPGPARLRRADAPARRRLTGDPHGLAGDATGRNQRAPARPAGRASRLHRPSAHTLRHARPVPAPG
ncbi:MAG: substrate-binding domain-containing protein [Bosea sp. (in: a-proteobacteria)]